MPKLFIQFSQILILSLLLFGCINISTTGQPINQAAVDNLVSGETSKFVLFELFGSPLSIAGQNEKLLAQAPHAQYGIYDFNFYDHLMATNSDSQFELFVDRHIFGNYHRVYHFQHYQSICNKFYFIFMLHKTGSSLSSDLWVLVDEQTGLVTDHFYRSR